MSRLHRSPKRPARMPKYPYKGTYMLPEERQGEIGELTTDCWSGDHFPKIYAYDGPFGTVDSRNGGTLDLDVEQHELAINMLGLLRPPVV